MPDRDLPVQPFKKIIESFGFKVEISRGFVTVTRAGSSIGWKQHLHKGAKDALRKDKVRAARRRLGLTDREKVTDTDFYSRM